MVCISCFYGGTYGIASKFHGFILLTKNHSSYLLAIASLSKIHSASNKTWFSQIKLSVLEHCFLCDKTLLTSWRSIAYHYQKHLCDHKHASVTTGEGLQSQLMRNIFGLSTQPLATFDSAIGGKCRNYPSCNTEDAEKRRKQVKQLEVGQTRKTFILQLTRCGS